MVKIVYLSNKELRNSNPKEPIIREEYRSRLREIAELTFNFGRENRYAQIKEKITFERTDTGILITSANLSTIEIDAIERTIDVQNPTMLNFAIDLAKVYKSQLDKEYLLRIISKKVG